MHSMNLQVRKNIIVLFAILIGAGVVFFAWKSINSNQKNSSGDIENSTGWEKSLDVVAKDYPSKTSSSVPFDPIADKEFAAKTATDIVGRTILSNYAVTQSFNTATTTLSDEEAIAIANSAIAKIDMPRAIQYSTKHLKISNDNSTEAVAVYTKSIETILLAFAKAQTKTDIEVAFAEPKKGMEEERLAAINGNISNYENLIKSLLALKTPSNFARIHLLLLQKFANIQVLILPLAEVFTDPIKALAALDKYRAEINSLPLLTAEFEKYFK